MRRSGVLLIALACCAKGPKKSVGGDASLDAAPETSAATAIAPASAAASIASAALGAPIASAPVVADSDRAAFAQATVTHDAIKHMVARGVFTDPQRPEEGDANMMCANIDGVRSRLETIDEPDVKTFLDVSKRTCSLDVPLLSAKAALDQLGYSSSQASKTLMCQLASREIKKARATKADDRRVRDTDARMKRLCNR